MTHGTPTRCPISRLSTPSKNRKIQIFSETRANTRVPPRTTVTHPADLCPQCPYKPDKPERSLHRTARSPASRETSRDCMTANVCSSSVYRHEQTAQTTTMGFVHRSLDSVRRKRGARESPDNPRGEPAGLSGYSGFLGWLQPCQVPSWRVACRPLRTVGTVRGMAVGSAASRTTQ